MILARHRGRGIPQTIPFTSWAQLALWLSSDETIRWMRRRSPDVLPCVTISDPSFAVHVQMNSVWESGKIKNHTRSEGMGYHANYHVVLTSQGVKRYPCNWTIQKLDDKEAVWFHREWIKRVSAPGPRPGSYLYLAQGAGTVGARTMMHSGAGIIDLDPLTPSSARPVSPLRRWADGWAVTVSWRVAAPL